MESIFASAGDRKILLGVIHLRPLPGSPRWVGDFDAVLAAARLDAAAYREGGADGVIVENFGDAPFRKSDVPAATIAAMSAAAVAVRAELRGLPLGFNVLRNDAAAALALCAVHGGSFIRVNVHTGVMVTDQGLIEGAAHETLRQRSAICPQVRILADVHVKHARPLAEFSIEESARDTVDRGLADGLIVTGAGTGRSADPSDLRRVRRACPGALIFLGSGTATGELEPYRDLADGFIVGTSLKREGLVTNPVDPARVAALREALG
jgi:membrane complex biogenesis BtpA family protein